jgi:hypothetical protein
VNAARRVRPATLIRPFSLTRINPVVPARIRLLLQRLARARGSLYQRNGGKPKAWVRKPRTLAESRLAAEIFMEQAKQQVVLPNPVDA